MTARLLILADALVREVRYAAQPATAPSAGRAVLARRASVCGKLGAVTFHVFFKADGKAVSVQSHLKCFKKYRRGGRHE